MEYLTKATLDALIAAARRVVTENDATALKHLWGGDDLVAAVRQIRTETDIRDSDAPSQDEDYAAWV